MAVRAQMASKMRAEREKLDLIASYNTKQPNDNNKIQL